MQFHILRCIHTQYSHQHVSAGILSLVGVWCKPYQLHISAILWIETRHIAALVTTPQTLNNFNLHNFTNYPFSIHIYIT